jgi:hypothetical protein
LSGGKNLLLLDLVYFIFIAVQKLREQNTDTETRHQTTKAKWATFTYSGKETRKITKLFKATEVKIAYRTRNTIENILKIHPIIDKYEKSGVYEMKCQDCELKYIGQTSRTFHDRYKEHIRAIRSNNGNSGHSNHILNTGHAHG